VDGGAGAPHCHRGGRSRTAGEAVVGGAGAAEEEGGEGAGREIPER
jgi:hypothetical protein